MTVNGLRTFKDVNGLSSRPADVFLGVLQGSVLRPILFIIYYARLCSLIETHSVSSQSFADDTQLLQSCPPDQIYAIVLTIQTCITDAEIWMTQDKLKLNDDKTGRLLMKSNRTIFPDAQPTSLRVGAAGIPFPTCACSLGFTISDHT